MKTSPKYTRLAPGNFPSYKHEYISMLEPGILVFLFKALDKSTPVAYKGSFVGAEDIVEWALEHVSVKFRRELLLLKGNDQKDDLNIVDSVSDAGAVARDEL